MAIVKATYTKSKAGAKATLQYIANRAGKDGQKVSRALFGHDGPMESAQAYRMIEEAEKGTIFYRLVISPDPEREDQGKDLNLWELTEQTMLHLEERLQRQVRYVATEHDDHSPHRHVHVLALLPGRLNAKDLAALRQRATEAALFQRRERDLAAEQQARGRLAQGSSYVPVVAHRYGSSAARKGRKRSRLPAHQAQGARGRLRLVTTAQTCPRCGSQLGMRQAVCGSCGLKLARAREKGVTWER